MTPRTKCLPCSCLFAEKKCFLVFSFWLMLYYFPQMLTILNCFYQFSLRACSVPLTFFLSCIMKVANYFYLGIGMKFYQRAKYVTLEIGSKNSLLDSDLIIGNIFTHVKVVNQHLPNLVSLLLLEVTSLSFYALGSASLL